MSSAVGLLGPQPGEPDPGSTASFVRVGDSGSSGYYDREPQRVSVLLGDPGASVQGIIAARVLRARRVQGLIIPRDCMLDMGT
eukprot:3017566-Rhodomonas_salina.2